MIPVAVLTGFLGSGKTTLLGHLVRQPEFARTAVIINEFGEVGLDHDLIETSEESFVQLQTGCLCCTIRGDLVLTLDDLLRRREAGTVPRFDRVVVETTGLADPAPILHALMTDAGLAGRVALGGVITTVDAVNGISTLERQPEAVKQAAVADRILLTKSDLVDGVPDALLGCLAKLNPAAPILRASFGQIDPTRMFDAAPYDPSRVLAWLAAEAHHHHAHDQDISSFCLIREAPIRAVTLSLLLEVLAEHCGADLLRLKGLVAIAENLGRPAVIHGVQHVFHPPAWLERWPSDDHRTRMVFIGRNLRRAWAEALIDALEAEVVAVAA